MPAGRPKGQPKTGGRKKGSVDRIAATVQQILDSVGVNPFEVKARIAKGDIECSVCRGKGKTLYQPSMTTKVINGTRVFVVTEEEGVALKPRTCLSCYGSGREIISPELRGKMAAELANYIGSKRKAIEISGELGVYTTIEKNLMAARQRAMEEENGKTQE